MAKVEFLFDRGKDIWNTWETVNNPVKYENDFSKNISEKIKAIAKNKKLEECGADLEKQNSKFYDSEIIPIFISSLNKSWGKIENEYFSRIEKITNNKFPKNKIKCYITTITKCPYNIKENWFMINVFSGLFSAILIAGHEIMHLHFHKYYFDNIANEVGKEKAHDIKEALIVLLNIDFRDLWFAEDRGYEKHKKLREFIVKQWKEKRDFDVLLEKCVEFVKKS